MYRNTGDREKIERTLGYTFRNDKILLQALTRRSALNEHRQRADIGDFQRLEFIGDKVLGLAISDILFENHPDWREGHLTTEVSRFVHNKGPLADIAKNIALGDYLIMGIGEERVTGRNNTKALSDAFEALIGALWIDSEKNFPLVRDFVLSQFKLLGLSDFNKDYTETVGDLFLSQLSSGLLDGLGLHEMATSPWGLFGTPKGGMTPAELQHFLDRRKRATKPLSGASAFFEKALFGLDSEPSEGHGVYAEVDEDDVVVDPYAHSSSDDSDQADSSTESDTSQSTDESFTASIKYRKNALPLKMKNTLKIKMRR